MSSKTMHSLLQALGIVSITYYFAAAHGLSIGSNEYNPAPKSLNGCTLVQTGQEQVENVLESHEECDWCGG